jgi:hypothetical protein
MSQFRFGKHPRKSDYRTLRLRNYLTAGLAPPPEEFDILPRVYDNLRQSNPAVLFPMDGNDKLGDCTIAGVAHALTVWNGMLKRLKVTRQAVVEKLYFHLTGGVDSGLNELDVLNHWQSTPVNGEKILAYVAVDRNDHDHVKQAISLFGCVYLGFQVQQDCLTDFDAGRPWTPGPLTNEGHCVVATGYDAGMLTVLTWGSTQKATWEWFDECVDEAYAIVPPEAKAADFDPGLDFSQLMDDLQDVAN